MLKKYGRAISIYWRRIPSGLRILSCLLALFLFLYALIPLPRPVFPRDYSRVILDENKNILRVFLNQQEHWILPPEKQKAIPEKLKHAVLHYEDRSFYRHRGVSAKAVLRALVLNLRYKKVMSGASTITMQVARLSKPKARTYANKLLEMLQAVKMEIRYSKEEILCMYLDHAPYGGNIKGYQAAAWKYFGKRAAELTWAQAATLAVLPNLPSLITPVVNRNKLITKRNDLLKTLVKQGYLDNSSYELAITEPAPDKVLPFPLLAPHATRRLSQSCLGQFTLQTTLNKDVQTTCKEILQRHLYFLRAYGIKNVCLLVAETKSGAIRAYVGSQDYHDNEHEGKVDGVQSPRSSGSILKPFLYAAAMDEGLILPDMKMKDIPTHFKGFSPQNYTKTFQGLVFAREALIQSLNVPAVRLLNTYGVYSFYLLLKAAGVTTLFRTADEYGLSLILGGSEVTLWEMVALYRGLGQGGIFQPLTILTDKSAAKNAGQRLLHPASCFLVLNMLRDVKRPGAEYYWEQFNNQRPIAWKTGTSYGSRDAWAIGTNPKWTIGVWVGNFTGEGNSNLSGARFAGPLLFDCFNALPQESSEAWFAKPFAQFTPVEICQDTGFIATELCPNTKIMGIPKHNRPFRRCPYHRIYHFDKEEKHTVCALCWETGYHKVVRLVYPPHIMHIMRKHGHRVSKIPAHNPRCSSVNKERAMDIVYPLEKAKIWIPRGIDGKFQKLIVQVTHRDRRCRVFWYMDDKYLGETRDKHDKAIAVSAGWHTIKVIDENGEKIERGFQTAVKGKVVKLGIMSVKQEKPNTDKPEPKLAADERR
ncbi:penicillin-binding protein 1C [bacterium]|nr:penicillin-binding protein 1C [bacterium]